GGGVAVGAGVGVGGAALGVGARSGRTTKKSARPEPVPSTVTVRDVPLIGASPPGSPIATVYEPAGRPSKTNPPLPSEVVVVFRPGPRMRTVTPPTGRSPRLGAPSPSS